MGLPRLASHEPTPHSVIAEANAILAMLQPRVMRIQVAGQEGECVDKATKVESIYGTEYSMVRLQVIEPGTTYVMSACRRRFDVSFMPLVFFTAGEAT